MVEELFTQEKFNIEAIYYTSDYEYNIPKKIDSFEISNKELERISTLKNPNKIIAIVNQNNPTSLAVDYEYPIMILDDIKDPGNFGTILRTADWYGFKTVICSEQCVELFNPKVIQSSMGAVYRINVNYLNLANEIETLKSKGVKIVGAGLNGSNIYDYSFDSKTAIVMGSESHGMSAEIISLLDNELMIPKYGESESLNVGIATGIFMAELRRQIS